MIITHKKNEAQTQTYIHPKTPNRTEKEINSSQKQDKTKTETVNPEYEEIHT